MPDSMAVKEFSLENDGVEQFMMAVDQSYRDDNFEMAEFVITICAFFILLPKQRLLKVKIQTTSFYLLVVNFM
ncbi:hypothetical protein [Neobacillus sp.]|uniref:hypothetical protein n=1 Tax=Neobacillus sp. TaxID=2675273 RepID=UPI0028A146E4|nr:hypothetical protein [Neobacillus sp.]